jgi:ubiquinone/menaquinone biosynthesis C-methylase UbiE
MDESDLSGFSGPAQIVAQGYDLVADKYVRLEAGAEWPRMRWLGKVLERLEPGSAVLDLGCGSGDPAGIEIAKMHQITGVDVSQSQINLARQNVPSGTFIHGDAGSADFPAASFDAVVSFYTLEHLPREEHQGLLARIYQWLRGNGYLLIGTEAAEVEEIVSEWLDVPMYFSSFDSETVMGMVETAGFEILETAVEPQMEGEDEISYLWLLARKKG